MYVMKEINIIPSEIVDKLTFECKVLIVIYMPVHTCIWQLQEEVLDWTELEMD